METRKIQSEYIIYQQESELDMPDRELLNAAKKFLIRSYSPYSKFQVAAAVRLDDGNIVLGANQENASFPISVCAEQVVLSHCGSNFPDNIIHTVAITARSAEKVLNTPVPPCGACRQSLAEYHNRQQHPIRIVLQAEAGPIYLIEDARSLLPLLFTNDFLIL